MRVLVVDDDPAFLEMLRAALAEEGHVVVVARDGRTGLHLADLADPDVILLDVLMRGMDGATFAREYARVPGHRAPIVVVSGASRAEARRVEPAAAFLAKPFELDELMGVLREVTAAA